MKLPAYVFLLCSVATAAHAVAADATRNPKTSPKGDTDMAKAVRPQNRPSAEWTLHDPERIDIGVSLGLAHRLDDAPLYQASERNGLSVGLGADLFLARRVSFGLAYEHVGLGAEESGLTASGEVNISREADALWVNLRIYPILLGWSDFYFRIAGGAIWQDANIGGSVWNPQTPGAATTFRCHGSDGANIGLRAEMGQDVRLSSGLRMNIATGVDAYRLSDRTLDDCVPGAGSATIFGARMGFAWAVDPR